MKNSQVRDAFFHFFQIYENHFSQNGQYSHFDEYDHFLLLTFRELDTTFEATDKYIAVLKKINCLNKQREEVYKKLKDLLIKNKCVHCFANIFSALQEFFVGDDFAWQVIDFLMDNIVDLITDGIDTKEALRERLSDISGLYSYLGKQGVLKHQPTEVPYIEDEAYQIERGAAIKEITSDGSIVYRFPVEDDVNVGELDMICTGYYLTDNEFEKISNLKRFACGEKFDICRNAILIGSYLSFFTKDKRITYKIIEKRSFKSYEELLNAYSVDELINNSNLTAEEFISALREKEDDYDGAVCLYLKRVQDLKFV